MIERLAVALGGAVQGVGFRPFVYRLAQDLELRGWVCNGPSGVRLEVEGTAEKLDAFLARLRSDVPAAGRIAWLESRRLAPCGHDNFVIRPSDTSGPRRVAVLPDLATCPDCRRELFDPADRRHRYPFINCTRCGPRWSILESLPYDRERTTMKGFPMCPRCRAEYEDPADRRFHAQPNACPECGPHLSLTDAAGRILAARHAALQSVVRALAAGRIVAVKGIGGFHLLVDARDGDAVRRLRLRKRRAAKPLAVMAADLDMARRLARVDPEEAALLQGVEAPIVLLEGRPGNGLAADIAPRNPRIGLMLPATPLHHLLLRELGFPIVATSGNLSEEPLCTEDDEARARLGSIADLFLGHDRPIARAVDDSVARIFRGRVQLLRRARGYAPLPVARVPEGPPLLAVGGQQKNSLALALGPDIILGPHVGDLDSESSIRAFRRTAAALLDLHAAPIECVAVDLHPDYAATREAPRFGRPIVGVQHHHAHLAAVMAEHRLDGPLLGVIWDGTGYGTDGTIWGGEFLRASGASIERVAHLRPFRLPGGEAAMRDPRRSAFGLLQELEADGLGIGPDRRQLTGFSPPEQAVLARLCRTGLNAPWTSSAGRLFDGVSALLGLCRHARFEGEAAMELEFAAGAAEGAPPFPIAPIGRYSGGARSAPLPLDWAPALRALLAARAAGVDAATLAGRFHATLAELILAVARAVGLEQVVVSGGCFQNLRLLREVAARLEPAGFRLCWPERIPPNDGGLSVGQAVLARRAPPFR